jgi:predicted regulator of Ras-like GTPase activity (Roadblock/LC7/MglB family)
LPLKIVAPLFMAKHRPARAQQKISIGEIPDLFVAKAQAVTAEPPASEPQISKIAEQPALIPFKPTPIVSVVEPAPAPVAPVEMPIPIAPTPEKVIAPTTPVSSPEIKLPVAPEIKPSVLGEIFGQPAKQSWTPNEVVKNLAALPGIAGAFVAMQDGLLVAAELPEHLKADTVAAFLPQIFGRMNQYTKELQLGGLSSLTFVVENVSWQIIKSGTVYLVALGNAGESLPGSKLNTIAAEIGRQIQ